MLRNISRKIRSLYTSEDNSSAEGKFKILPWNEDEVFAEIMSAVGDQTLVDPVRCYMIYQLAKQALKIKGDVAEVGVYKGGTAKLIASVFRKTKTKIHLFDTFQGMPDADPEKDFHKKGDFGDTSLE
jgi:O-methyltransferase